MAKRGTALNLKRESLDRDYYNVSNSISVTFGSFLGGFLSPLLVSIAPKMPCPASAAPEAPSVFISLIVQFHATFSPILIS